MKDKILGAIVGLSVADALGVPVEFESRESLLQNPVTDMRGFGSNDQPPGTWSDDTSMTLCLLESLTGGLDYTDIMMRFLAWLDHAEYTPRGAVFDVGQATMKAIFRFAQGMEPLMCGGTSEYDNGNGALMRILPLVFYLHAQYGDSFMEKDDAIDMIHKVSALTHAHKRSLIACGIYLSIAEMLIGNMKLENAIQVGLDKAKGYYEEREEYAIELEYYQRIFHDGFKNLPAESIKSSGYVVDTLEAAIWCLLTTDSYESCVLKAVNLGGDTDTVAAVSGGLTGMYYGIAAIPETWRSQTARLAYIKNLCEAYYLSLCGKGEKRSDME